MSVLPMEELRAAGRADGQRAQGRQAQDRPSLEALPKVRRRQRGMLASVLLLLLTALGAVLAVNIHVANSQYQVVQLTNQHRDLVHQNQALAQQVQFLESPQSLSNSAVAVGMVMPATAGTFDLSSAEIVSSAEAASSSEVPSNFVGAPGYSQPETAAADVSQQASGAPSGLLGAGALHTLRQAPAGENGSGGGEESASRPGSALHGGTIPAPDVTD
ncbi:hypothetical protein [Nesterenkonia alkaliphila]|uniref:Cell division protein FtsL n=1 Tax=Nesterenkonia alkaliphila TaxID=1463631 RepID=A0A7K1UG98_9MICC|nr:hypothetical protein [Nesterenkonia alkaliphila]MVT25442.1 hypothetical protein [Nesterenkonia alkaliphila]GFZ83907.1 hypothetical protein GCM10011359_10770 [Nesterenkonia alkaliphila]